VGLLAVSAVGTFAIFAAVLFDWFGWLPDMSDDQVFFTGFHFWLLVVELLTVMAAGVALRLFRFPLLVFVLAGASWLFVFDLLSNGGDWAAIVSIAIGLVFLLAGIAVDRGPSRPFGFWLHVAAGLAIGGGLVWFFHDGDFDWIVVALVGLVYIAFGNALARSSWVVLGGWGILQGAAHFADKWSDVTNTFGFFLFPFTIEFDSYDEHHAHQWAGPLIFAATGLVFIGIGLVLARRARPPLAEI
jgi:hypothetical protein